MPKIHIVHVIHKLSFGGLENGLINLINQLPPHHYKHTLLVLTEKDHFENRIQCEGVTMVTLNKKPGPLYQYFPELYRTIKGLKPQIVHTRNLSTLECQLPAALAKVPYRIHSEHGRDHLDLKGVNQKSIWVRRFMKPFVHRYVALSHDLRHYLQTCVGVPKDKLVQIYNGVDTDYYQPQALPLKERRLVSVGRLTKVKDFDTLIRAFEKVLLKEPDVTLDIVGDGPEKESLISLCRKLNLHEKVTFWGFSPHVLPRLQASLIYVQSSLFEGVSNTLLEAMSTGLPVIATDVGGNSELIQEGETGLLVSPQNVDQLAEKILYLLRNPSFQKELAKAARERVLSRFSLKDMVRQYDAIYSTPPFMKQLKALNKRTQ